MALGIGYGLPFVAQHGNTNPYKMQWVAARDGAKNAGATVEDENAGVGSCLVSRGQDVYTDGLPFTPLLLIVPQFYKAGNLYQDVPPFVAEDSTMRFTVSRNTTATRVDSNGLIASVASGVPRIDWLGQSCPGLLVEASGQNLALQSEGFSVSGTWVPEGTNPTQVTANSTGTLDPAGGNTADIITLVSGSTNQLRQSFISTSGTIYTASIFFKNIALTSGQTFLFSTTNQEATVNQVNCTIDLANLTITAATQGAGVTVSNTALDNYGNGWYRARFTFSFAVGGNNSYIRLRQPSSVGTNYAFYAWGAQLETGSVATTYIPTTTAAVSRAADVISASGALVSSLIGQTAGTIYCEFAYFGTPTARSGPVYLRQGSLRGLSISFAPSDSPSGIRFSSRNNAGTSTLNIVSGALQLGTFYKVAIGYDAAGTAAGGTQASGVVAYVNGVQTDIGAFRVPDAAGLTEIRMYGAVSGDDTEAFNGRIRSAALYTTRLSNDQLAELTRL